MSNERPRFAWDLRVPTAEQPQAWMAPTQIAFAEATSGMKADDWTRLVEPERWPSAFESPQSEEPAERGARRARSPWVPRLRSACA